MKYTQYDNEHETSFQKLVKKDSKRMQTNGRKRKTVQAIQSFVI